jgi:hypothetical protein
MQFILRKQLNKKSIDELNEVLKPFEKNLVQTLGNAAVMIIGEESSKIFDDIKILKVSYFSLPYFECRPSSNTRND